MTDKDIKDYCKNCDVEPPAMRFKCPECEHNPDKEQIIEGVKQNNENTYGGFMTDKEQIMIDGVDINKCEFYDKDKKYCLTLKMYPNGFSNPSCFSGDFQNCIQDSKTCPYTFCHNNPNCYFKQLARKTQECEQLKKECEKYKQALFEIKIYCKTALCVSISKNDINFIQMIIDIIDKAMRPK